MIRFWETGHKIRLATILAVLCAATAVCCRAQTGVVAASGRSVVAPSPTRHDKSLPEPFASILPKIKAKSRIPVLLPSDLAQPASGAKHAVIEKASDKEYAIILFVQGGHRGRWFRGVFSGPA
jgi:hypothetical protein